MVLAFPEFWVNGYKSKTIAIKLKI